MNQQTPPAAQNGSDAPEAPQKQIKWKVHPAAEVFPMMSDDELDEMAQDIKNSGQRFAIVRDNEDRIVDGRNRLEACKRAGVEPRFETLKNGQDPVSFILSANIARRHLNKGQQAMAVAMIYPEPEPGRKNAKTSILNIPCSPGYVNKARTVLKYAPDMADPVRLGAVALNDAYEAARVRKFKSETSEERLRKLQASAPDLAMLVVEEKLKLPEAEAAQKNRQLQRERELRDAKWQLGTVLSYLTQRAAGRLTPITGRLPSEQFMRNGILVLPDFDLEELSAALQNLKLLVEEKKKQIASKPPAETAAAPDGAKVEVKSERKQRRALQIAANQQRSLLRRVRGIEEHARKSAEPSTEEPPPKKQTVHQRFADMLALANCSTPHDFMQLALENGLLRPEHDNFDKIPAYVIEEFMKPNNWRDTVKALDERRVRRDEEAAAAAGALL